MATQLVGLTENGNAAFVCHPRISGQLCGTGWLACGTAALGFDPLCGDGTGHAVREAVLASAIIRSAADNADVDALLAHYESRFIAGLRRHLEHCVKFYQDGDAGEWWELELAPLREGLHWCTHRLTRVPAPKYMLNGFKMQLIPSALEHS